MSEKSQGAMTIPEPGPEHDRLKPFEGKFRARVRLWMGPGDPVVSTGTMTNSFDLGGRFLRQDYRGDPGEGPFPDFEGRGFWGYNTTTKRYEGFWIDNVSTMMQTEAGDVDDSGKVWTMTGEMPDPQSGEMMNRRSVITLQDSDRHKLEIFFSKAGREFKAMEIDYERAR